MQKTKLFIGGLLLNAAIASSALAASNPLSVHVLNLQDGLPSAGVNVTLEKKVDNKWVQISEVSPMSKAAFLRSTPPNPSWKRATIA